MNAVRGPIGDITEDLGPIRISRVWKSQTSPTSRTYHLELEINETKIEIISSWKGNNVRVFRDGEEMFEDDYGLEDDDPEPAAEPQ